MNAFGPEMTDEERALHVRLGVLRLEHRDLKGVDVRRLLVDRRLAVIDRHGQCSDPLDERVGAPFVPIEHEGVIYIRPPVG